MRPMTFINGVIFGSAAALGGVLGVILFLRYVLTRDSSLDQTVIRGDLPLGELLRDMLAFSALALLASAAFWGQVAKRRWRWAAEYVLAVAIAAAIIMFLASAGDRNRDLLVLTVAAVLGIVIWLAGWYSGFLQRIRAWLEEDG
ncbi:MAG: hypothetical protein WCC11_02485 [Gammaproteobacteria bacterium]